MPENLSELLNLGFEHTGDFSLNGVKLCLTLLKHKDQTGCYAFVVDQHIRYIGVTKKNLYTRMNFYKNPGPSQQTNLRVNPKIKEAGLVKIYFLPESEIQQFTTVIQRKGFEKNIPTDLSTFERFLISSFKPEWNRE